MCLFACVCDGLHPVTSRGIRHMREVRRAEGGADCRGEPSVYLYARPRAWRSNHFTSDSDSSLVCTRLWLWYVFDWCDPRARDPCITSVSFAQLWPRSFGADHVLAAAFKRPVTDTFISDDDRKFGWDLAPSGQVRRRAG